ncbi:19987_t:CDS:2, partial [Gigaspora margarita]
ASLVDDKNSDSKDERLEEQTISLMNQKTWNNFKNLPLASIFQLDTPSAWTFFNRLRPYNFSDLIPSISKGVGWNLNNYQEPKNR